jgi:hypothetical protein
LISICIHWLLVNSVNSPSLHQVPNDVLKQAERKLLKVKEQEEQLLRAAEKAATAHGRKSDALNNKPKSEDHLNLARTAAVSKVSNVRENGVHSGGKMATEQLTDLGPRVKENGGHHSNRTTVQEQQGITYYYSNNDGF